jgi:hypothetical protein
VQECAQFARDRCLHGLPVPDPGAIAVNACVQAIQADTSCAIVASPELAPACSFLLASASAQDAGTDTAAIEAGD